MASPLRRFAPSSQGDDTFAARRLLLGVSSLGRALSGSLGSLFAGGFLCLSLSGCAVVAVTSTAISVTAGAVGLAADAAIGTAKIVGKGVGKAADALMDDDKPDNSGIHIQYRDAANPAAAAADAPLSTAVTTEPIAPITPPSAIQPMY